jgi:uncharacterized protein YggE
MGAMRHRTLGTALVLLAAAAMLTLTACTTTTVSSAGPAADTVTAIGTGTGTAAPDTAEISLGVTFTSKDRLGAQDKTSKATAAVIAAVKAAGIDTADIQTGRISLDQQYGSNGNKVVGYQASQSIDVKTKSVDRISAAVTAATTAGATDISDPTFSLADASTARVDAIGKAMADAKSRAQAMAKAAGRTLGRVISVAESETNQASPLYRAAAEASAKSSVPVPVETGTVETQAQLTVIFALQ